MTKQSTEPQHIELAGHRLLPKSAPALRRKVAWDGGIVRAKVGVGNSQGRLPAGSYYLIIRNHGGLELLSLPCRCCGFRLHVSKVEEHEVDYLGHPENEEDCTHWHRGRPSLNDWRVNGPKDTAKGEKGVE